MSTAPARANLPLSRVDWISDLIRLEIVLWERIDAGLRERHGLPLSFFESLHFISHAPEASLRVGDLARALRVTVGGTSKLVDRIEAAGLIARTPTPTTARCAGHAHARRASASWPPPRRPTRRSRGARRPGARPGRTAADAPLVDTPARRGAATTGPRDDRHDARRRARGARPARSTQDPRAADPRRPSPGWVLIASRHSGSTAPSCTPGLGSPKA